MTKFIEDVEDTTEFDQIDSGNIWKDEVEMRFKLETFRSFMKKMGYNWNEKECTRFLEQGKALPKAKFKGIQTRHWVVTLPKQMEHKNKDVKFTKAKAAWEDN
jgi:hypothetical protein